MNVTTTNQPKKQRKPVKLTGREVLPTGKNDDLLFDLEMRGLALRLRRSGDRVLRSWVLVYRSRGKGRRYLIGRADVLSAVQARKTAKDLLAKITLGQDPHDQRAADRHLLSTVITAYLEHKRSLVADGKRRPATLLTAERYLTLKMYLGPLGSFPVDRITRKDVASSILRIERASGATTAACARRALSSMFSWAMSTGMADSNPTIGSYKPELAAPRERVLSNDELVKIWKAVEGVGDFAVIVRLLTLSACRRDEIGLLQWSELNLDEGVLSLPGQRTKNGVAHVLPITPLMLSVIEQVPVRDGIDHLFGKGGFTKWGRDKRLLDDKLDGSVAKWTLHDLRRSAASGLGNLGIQPHIIEVILNHKSGFRGGVGGTYNRSPYEREVRAAMALWSDHIAAITSGAKCRVVAFDQRAANVGGAS
jgi:integrase